MKTIIIKIILLAVINITVLQSQEIALNNWQIHTSMHNSLCAISDWQNKIWIGTIGGIAVYNDETDTLPILLNVGNALLSQAITVLYNISDDYIVAGTDDGVLEIINTITFECEHITSIRDHNFSNPRINDFCLLDAKTLLVVGNFGMAVFDIEQKIFPRTILTIGDYPSGTPINNIVLRGDSIYISTPNGIAWTTIDKQIHIPSNWGTLRYGGSLSNPQAKIVSCAGNIFAKLGRDIYLLKGNAFEVYPRPNNDSIIDIGAYNNKLLFTTIYQLWMVDDIEQGNMRTIYTNWDSRNNGIAVLNNNNLETKIVMLFNLLGAAFIKEENDDYLAEIKTPNTPFSNSFRGLALNKEGILYVVTDNSQKNESWGPFISFDGKDWTNYHPRLSSFPYEASFNSISISSDNKIYVGAWGDGLCVMDDTNVIRYDTTNSALFGYVSTSNYVVCGNICFDREGNAWVSNFGTGAGPMVVMFDKDGNSYGFVNPFSISDRRVFNMAIDANNTKWIAGNVDEGNGLFYFNERNSITDATNHIWGHLTSSRHPNLIGNIFYTCIYDNFTNTVWLGTSTGLAIINNPNAALTNSNFVIVKNKLLEGQHINDIFIDATGNKWISTKNGLWIISMDGAELLAHFTTANTPLTDNDVQTVTINPNNGLVYIGTANGLFIAQGNILMPQSVYEIKTFPQPYNIRKHSEVIIDGLTAESDIRIVTPDGVLVRRIITSSRRAVWDGRDINGNLVPAGIYLVLSNSNASNSGGAAKIVIVDY